MAQKPVDEWTLEDALGGFDAIKRRAARAPQGLPDKSCMTLDDALNIIAKEIVEGLSDGSAEDRFLKYVRRSIAGESTLVARTRAAADFAMAMSDRHCSRMMEWLKYKGVITRVSQIEVAKRKK